MCFALSFVPRQQKPFQRRFHRREILRNGPPRVGTIITENATRRLPSLFKIPPRLFAFHCPLHLPLLPGNEHGLPFISIWRTYSPSTKRTARLFFIKYRRIRRERGAISGVREASRRTIGSRSSELSVPGIPAGLKPKRGVLIYAICRREDRRRDGEARNREQISRNAQTIKPFCDVETSEGGSIAKLSRGEIARRCFAEG